MLTVVWVAATYMGSISVAQEVKWVWFLISLFGLAAAIFNFARTYDNASKSKSEELAKLYSKMAWTTIGVFACYPLVWLFSEGFGNFSVSFEVWLHRSPIFLNAAFRSPCTASWMSSARLLLASCCSGLTTSLATPLLSHRESLSERLHAFESTSLLT